MEIGELKILIPSETVRDYVVETGWIFTDREKAALLFRSNCMNDLPLEAYYLRLRDRTPDRELGAEITEYLECLGQSVQIFGENHGRNSIYVLKIQDDGESGWYQTGTFFDWETALAQGKKAKVPFQIEKYPVGDIDRDGACRHVLTADFYFDKDGEAVSFWSREISGHCDDNRHFTRIYFEVPNPFETGDIIKIRRGGGYGIVETSRKDWKESVEKYRERL